MEDLNANYVKLSSRIFVPMDWPVGGFKKLLLSLATKVIDDVVSDQIIVLQVNRVPTTLTRYQDESGVYYVFEKVCDQELPDAYMIDVIINKNIIRGRNSTGAGTSTAENASVALVDENSNNEISFDDYVICTYETENRTAYHVVPATQIIQTRRPERNITRATHQHPSGGVERPDVRHDALRSFAELGITVLVLMIVISTIIFCCLRTNHLMFYFSNVFLRFLYRIIWFLM